MRALLASIMATGGLVAAAAAHATPPQNGELLYARKAPGARQAIEQRITMDHVLPASDLQTPLGSLWKLFVYYYAVDRGIPTPAYVCQGDAGHAKEEVYCCDPGASISRDRALAQSCGLFFEPARLHLNARDWRAYWTAHAPGVHWLAELRNLRPAQDVPVASLLQALAAMDGDARAHAESALLAVMVTGRGQSALRYLGGRYRVKTYTWVHPERRGVVFGGAAGWTSDGGAVWFGAVGSSAAVLRDHAPRLAAALPASSRDEAGGRCVDVALFARYPIRRIVALDSGAALRPGASRDLRGRFRAEFMNGHRLNFSSGGEVQLAWQDGGPSLSARLDEQEYIARVLDREAGTAQPEAAKALTVVARTYLLQNAVRHGACMAIADSSRTQRVSPNPATAAARAIANFTSGLVLEGAAAQYRLQGGGPNVLSWKAAVQRAKQGMLFDEILRWSFANSSIASVGGAEACHPFPAAQQWLAEHARHWRAMLEREPGFASPRIQVCRLEYGNPYSDSSRQRIYVRGLRTLNDRYALAHEYLHVAFYAYPSGQDEDYIEHWARKLIDGGTEL
jgi:uncharacterized protein YfaQ (DUF2300 family)